MRISDLADYDPICRDLIRKYPLGIVALLRGELGAGKTAFAQRFAIAAGEAEASSPTYALMHEYSPNFRHIDLYRSSFAEALSLGIMERALDDGWTFIEWADADTENYIKNNDRQLINIVISVYGDDREISVSDVE